MTPQKEKLEKGLIVGGIILAVLELCVLLFFLIWQQSSSNAVQTEAADQMQTIQKDYWILPPTQSKEPYIPPNRFAAEDFAYDGDYLTCLAEESMLGIDVSTYQGNIDWKQVADAGIQFVMIRLGGRGYGEEGNLFADDMAHTNYQGAKEAGLLVGAYFFSQAIHPDEAVEEAEYALQLCRDWEMDLPLVYDWEYIGEYARTAWVDE